MLIPIKIPKVPNGSWIQVEVYKSKYEQWSVFEKIYLKKQSIAGVDIPKDSVIVAKCQNINYDELLGKCSVEGSEINKLLKFITLEKLRNNNN